MLKKALNTSRKYVDSLDHESRSRYVSKCGVIDGKDPYDLDKQEWNLCDKNWPSISYIDIVNYLIYARSSYSMDELRAYKSTEAYKLFVSGWVRDISSHVHNDSVVVCRTQVLHSQRLSEKPLNPWIIAEKTGTILTAHCDCMAGIGESCTHVGALLFKLDAAVRIRDAKTVTQEKAYWLLPTNLNTTGYSQVCDTDFTSARTMKKQLDCKVDNLSSMHSPSPSTRTNTTPAKKKVIPTTSLAEMTTFYERLNVANSKAAILSVLPVYCDQFIPVSIRDDYPQLLTELNDDRANQMNFGELALHCSKISITATKRQRVNVEQDTRGQSSSKLWFHCRAGRITASRMKRVCHTDIHKPSQSLIKQICYPGEIKFKNEATEWGCSHESVALDKYKEYMVDHHEDFEILPAGLFLDADDPFIGASPDAIVNCKCCGRGCVEVKCPFCARDSELDSVKKSSWCLDETDGIRKLKRNHEYYYQVMSQINVCNVEYCDFVVWTTKDVHYERIECDAEFWAEAKQKATQFFRLCVLPELVGHFYSRPSSASVNENIDLSNICIATEPSPDVWCYCKQGESDTMIACDNVDCRVKWFHTSCLMMQKIPKGKWICPDCAKLRKFCRIKYHKI